GSTVNNMPLASSARVLYLRFSNVYAVYSKYQRERSGGYSEQTLPPYRRKVYHLFRAKVYHLLATCITNEAFHRLNITDLFFSSQGLAQKFYSMRGSCQSVKDRLGRGRLVNELIPFIDR